MAKGDATSNSDKQKQTPRTDQYSVMNRLMDMPNAQQTGASQLDGSQFGGGQYNLPNSGFSGMGPGGIAPSMDFQPPNYSPPNYSPPTFPVGQFPQFSQMSGPGQDNGVMAPSDPNELLRRLMMNRGQMNRNQLV
jgi:hypothetical protein